jgi:dipeptidyl-peptidase-4
MPNERITSAIIAVLSFLVTASVAAQEERLELDWFFSEEGKSATTLPRYTWLDTGTVVLYDMHLPKNERTLETVNPANGRRRAMVDAEKAIASLTELMEPKEAIEELGWPSAFNASGRWALYQKSGDIVLLDTSSSEFIAVAMTGADESSGRFSPDGKWLAFVRDNDIYAWNIEEREETRLTRDGSDTLLNGTLSWVYWEELFNRSDRGYVWSPDSSAIAYLQSDESGVGEMHYVDFEPYLPRLITQRHAKPGEANPRVRAGVVNLEDARTTWVDLGSYPYEYLVRLKWLPDSERLAVQTMNRPQTALDIYIADAESGNATHLMRETDEGWVNVHDDLYFLQDSEQFIWRSERNGYAHLYMFDMTGELSHQVTAGEWALRSSGGTPGMSQAVSFVDEDAGQIYFTALEKASTERHLYRIDFNGDNL